MKSHMNYEQFLEQRELRNRNRVESGWLMTWVKRHGLAVLGFILLTLLLLAFVSQAEAKSKKDKGPYVPLKCMKIEIVKWGNCESGVDGRMTCDHVVLGITSACTTYTRPPKETATVNVTTPQSSGGK